MKWIPGERRYMLKVALPPGIAPDSMERLVTELMRAGAHHGGDSDKSGRGLLLSEANGFEWRSCVDYLKGAGLLDESGAGMLRLIANANDCVQITQMHSNPE
eukprot:8100263-Heterocapsa_arctica.AAC.1